MSAAKAREAAENLQHLRELVEPSMQWQNESLDDAVRFLHAYADDLDALESLEAVETRFDLASEAPTSAFVAEHVRLGVLKAVAS